MPTAEEILASLDVDDEGEQEESPEEQGRNENSAIRSARKAAKDWESKAKTLAQEVKDLQAFKAQVESSTKAASAKDVLAELGLNDKQASKQAELFLKVHDGDVTPEAVKQFAVDYGLVDEGDGSDETPPVVASRSFEPGGTGGTAGADPPELMTRDNWEALYFRDKDAAMKVAREGKVDLSGTPLGR